MNRRVVVSLLLLIAVVTLIMSNAFWRWMYPIGYQETIQRAAREAGLDPLLVASVIRVESQFRSRDVSHAGAVGLMQLMPATAEWVMNQMRRDGQPLPADAAGSRIDLAQPDINIRIGTWYIHYLMERFGGNAVAAIAAYNAGPKRVQGWLGRGVWDGRLEHIMAIPVGETRHFVDRVFYNYDLYKRIYGSDPAWRQP